MKEAVMMFRARYAQDGTMAGVGLMDGDFGLDVEWSQELLEAADPAFLSADGDRITLTVDQGVATYRVLGPGHAPDSLRSRLAFVRRPDGTGERWAIHDVMNPRKTPSA